MAYSLLIHTEDRFLKGRIFPMFNSIKSKILILCSGAVLLTAVVLVSVIAWQKTALKADVASELNILARN